MKHYQGKTAATSAKETSTCDRLLRLKSVQECIPLSKSAIYSAIAHGRFPAPVKLGRNSFWRESSIKSVVAGLTPLQTAKQLRRGASIEA
jgi:predicted DNA-binding transcriptional regulator AlpA